MVTAVAVAAGLALSAGGCTAPEKPLDVGVKDIPTDVVVGSPATTVAAGTATTVAGDTATTVAGDTATSVAP